ncbi:SusC/RagA family TonB-linked outer membrane protein [Chitinophaga lutea]|uniref:SusC/RagA family TonB-linked outer membrane protein n=1 Tax=Chitinophaga lutea TaxID=2488634 RepID=A0A3N4PWZ9_9BACT|nr:SusC/RagA family TonB-linked outer membrane protein [Chitinophaga lutea]RPE11995.1 SusC/RagA family TonB-linked outer membrane protein [Chitinophaga lutea]
MFQSVRIILTCLLLLCLHRPSHSQGARPSRVPAAADSTRPMLLSDTLFHLRSATVVVKPAVKNAERWLNAPFASLSQLLKGNIAGLYVQEHSGESGVELNMLIRGAAIPYTHRKDMYETQPLIVLDGVPLVAPHPFVYDIQQYGFTRLGAAFDFINRLDVNDIASVRVIKDVAEGAAYGPRAVNGVIEVNTKQATAKRNYIAFNSWFGFVQRPNVTTTNAASENSFRKPFYDRYATGADFRRYPSFLRDSTNPAYYGPANWTDLYYRNAAVRGTNISISGGYPRANFRLSIGNQHSANPADKTDMDRYTASFSINMMPLKWLTISTMLNGARLERDRNTYLRDRFAEMRYLPDLMNPLPPNKDRYARYLGELEKSYDDNKANALAGFFRLKADVGKGLHLTSQLSFDYTEDMRDVFYPGTLLEGNNYASNYIGYNQRIIFDNAMHFTTSWKRRHTLKFDAGQSLHMDFYKYDYIYAYKGPNDRIKINQIDNNTMNPKSYLYQLIYKFLDKERLRLSSLYGRVSYQFLRQLEVSLLVRTDASSNMQPTARWFVSPTASVKWDMKPTVLESLEGIDYAILFAGWGRVGRLLTTDRFAQGPQYTVDMSWTGEPVISSYGGISGLMRPYTYGYVGNGINWPYCDQFNAGLDVSLAEGRLSLNVALYSKTDRNLLIGVPAYSDYGYTSAFKNGMDVRNTGVDVALAIRPLKPGGKIGWIASLAAGYNRNKLLALPGGLRQLTIGERHLEVGKAFDQFWVLENDGIYNGDNEVPVNPATRMPLHYKGITLAKGDPRWKDRNGDFAINDEDKVLTGHYLPAVTGSLGHDFTYGCFNVGFSLYAAFGRTILHQAMASRFDFINKESTLNMDAVKEITYWTKTGDYSKYPVYNPWSNVVPYRTDQDLFLENGSFVKLRHVMIGYDFTGADWWKRRKWTGVKKLYLYGNAANLLTFTPYSGRDPELTDFRGYDMGYGLPIPKTYSLGVKLEL